MAMDGCDEIRFELGSCFNDFTAKREDGLRMMLLSGGALKAEAFLRMSDMVPLLRDQLSGAINGVEPAWMVWGLSDFGPPGEN